MSRSERRIAHYVEDLLRNRRPRRFHASLEELSAMRAAIRLRSARLGADVPDPAFVDRLGRRLRREMAGAGAAAGGVPLPALSRRRLLVAAGAAAVAGGVAGIAGERVAGSAAAMRGAGRRELVPAGATWHPVVAVGELADGEAVRFSTDAVEGFVIRRAGEYQALSAVCTHLGCVLQQANAGQLLCPCHRTAFDLDGSVLSHQLPQAPPALPQMRTRVRDGKVEVLTA
ncbi:MAG TPA: Rieske (2Fe-2S) protein [Candidatus Dormibacteraeota bacterium]